MSRLSSNNAMISGYVQNELFLEAVYVFSEMQLHGLMPLQATYSTLLGAAGVAAHIDRGRQLRCMLIKAYSNLDLILENSFTSMCSKGGQLSDALQIFSNMNCKDVIPWNSMIMGFSHHGLAREALSLFDRMVKSRMKPNSVTFLVILTACSRTGLIEEGWAVYRAMSELYGIYPGIEHDISMINLLGRSGKVDEAEQFVLHSPFKKDVAIWGALLGVCGLSEVNYEIASLTSK